MITKVEAFEYQKIAEVWEVSVRATHTFLSEADIAFFKPKILDEYLYAVDLLAYRDASEEIIGFIGIHESKIEMLFVHPKHFKQGIGKVLTQYVIQNHCVHEVDVNEQNPEALAFYEHMGFKVISRSDTDGLGKPFPLLHMKL